MEASAQGPMMPGSGGQLAPDIGKVAAAETQHLDAIANQLDRFERWLNMLEANLGSVLLQHETTPGDVSVEVPDNALHAHEQQFDRLLHRAEEIRSRIRL